MPWLRSGWVLGVLLVVQAGLLVWSARVHSPTWDETGHLAAGISHWELGRFELYSVNPPLVRTVAAAPVMLFDPPQMDWRFYRSDPKLRSEVYLGRRMMQLVGEDAMGLFFLARLAVIPIALLGTWLCFLWGRDLFGETSGLVAACLWTFSPSVLAYGAIITPDLASAVALMAASYVGWQWMKRPNWSLAVCLSATLALAMLTKSVWLLLPGVLAATWIGNLVWKRWMSRKVTGEQQAASRKAEVPWGSQAWQLGTLSVGALLLVNGFYGFQGSFRPLGEYQFASALLSGPPQCAGCERGIGNRFRDSWLAGVSVPLPANLVEGLDVQRRDFERGRYSPSWQSYLLGRWQQGGWWYYYLVGLFVKIPLVVWCLVGVASVGAWFWKTGHDRRLGVVCLWVPALVFLFLLSINTGLNRYVRYALPVLPALLIWASQVGRWVTAQRQWPAGLVGAACAVLAFVSVSNAPNWLGFFNSAAGGPAHGYQVLSDSNVDWGQDFAKLQGWLEEHPEARENLHLAAFSSYDPACLGIDYQLPPPLQVDAHRRPYLDQKTQGPRPGWYVISKNYLAGHVMPLPDGRNRIQFKYFGAPVFAYFQHFEPAGRIGQSMLVYHLEPEQVEQVREKLELVPLAPRVSSPNMLAQQERQSGRQSTR